MKVISSYVYILAEGEQYEQPLKMILNYLIVTRHAVTSVYASEFGHVVYFLELTVIEI